MTNYQRGADFERRVAVDLTAAGYAVFRSAGSRGIADLLAIKPGLILLIQCKRSGEIDLGEWNKLIELAERLDPTRRTILPLLAQMPGRTGIAYRLLRERAEPRQRRLWRAWHPESGEDEHGATV